MSRFASHNTPQHDMIHKWISDGWNRQVVCFKTLKKYRPPIHDRKLNSHSNHTVFPPRKDGYMTKLNPEGFLLETEIRQEVPLINGDYTLGIIDAIIKATFYRVKSVTKTSKIDRRANNYDIVAGEKYTEILMCEFKPSLYGHLTEILQQMNYYETYVKQQYHNNGGQPLTKLLITTDSNKQYDRIIESNGIRIYRIYHENQNELPPNLWGSSIGDIIERDDYHDFSMIGYNCTHRYKDCLENGFKWEEYNIPSSNLYAIPNINQSCDFFKDLDEYDAI